MNAPKCNEQDYIDFLIGTPRYYTCTEAARVQPKRDDAPAHDSLTRLLHRIEPDSETLWHEAHSQVQWKAGVLVLDDSTLDKPYARQMDLVSRHWSGKHQRVVQGINLVSLIWSDGDAHLPCDYRIYDKDGDGTTKNGHFKALLEQAKARGFHPSALLFDSWYASLANLKQVRDYGWIWLTQLKANRLINPDNQGNIAVARALLDPNGHVVHLKGYGMIRVFRTVAPNGDANYWATNDLKMTPLKRVSLAEQADTIEQYHRGIKQFCGVERCQVRAARAQRNHIGFAIRAFLRLEWHSLRTGYSWQMLKVGIIRDAVRAYLANPLYQLHSTA